MGGGILVDYWAYPVIKNNIITNCTHGEGIYVSFVGGDREISYNNVWNNSGGNFAGNITPDASNISLDPLYLDPVNGNYNLAGGSPCIDAGDPTLPQDPDGTIADIGAYYYHQSVAECLKSGRWQSLTMTRNADNVIRLYVDGVLERTQTCISSLYREEDF